MPIYGKINTNVLTATGSFIKSDSANVAFTKTGDFTVSTKSNITLEVNSQTITIPANTAVSMPTANTGTDYVVWVTPSGTIQATTDFTNAPVTNARKIGGFHYAPGGNATGQAGGNATPSINPHSFWDLKFRPTCNDPRGMALVSGDFWCDIYLTGVDAITNGSSKYNVTIADGSSPPKIPAMFGGSGSSTYGSYTWFEAQELAANFGKQCPSYWEFASAAFGTTEATSSGGTDVPTTGVNGTGATSNWNVFTSKWGLIQASGCLWVWGRERGGPYNTTADWVTDQTESRGAEYNAPNASLFGGAWYDGSISGSRCSNWNNVASSSSNGIGSRFVCDHLILD